MRSENPIGTAIVVSSPTKRWFSMIFFFFLFDREITPIVCFFLFCFCFCFFFSFLVETIYYVILRQNHEKITMLLSNAPALAFYRRFSCRNSQPFGIRESDWFSYCVHSVRSSTNVALGDLEKSRGRFWPNYLFKSYRTDKDNEN